jgi:cytochrome c biogenesis protein CcdA
MSRPRLLYQKIFFVFHLLLSLVYLGIGVFFFVSPVVKTQLPQTVIWVMGIGCMVYGLFRGWRVIYNTYFVKE